jgi:ABC-type nitrate/sulfonate/bicarbonate transport system permease component
MCDMGAVLVGFLIGVGGTTLTGLLIGWVSRHDR